MGAKSKRKAFGKKTPLMKSPADKKPPVFVVEKIYYWTYGMLLHLKLVQVENCLLSLTGWSM